MPQSPRGAAQSHGHGYHISISATKALLRRSSPFLPGPHSGWRQTAASAFLPPRIVLLRPRAVTLSNAVQSGCSTHPPGHLSGKAAQNKWKTKWQFSRKAVFLALQSERFKPAAVSGASSFLLCLGLFKLSSVCSQGSPEWLLPIPTGNHCSEVSKVAEETCPVSIGGYGGALQCCKPTHFRLQPHFTGKEAYSSVQVTLGTKPSPLPGTASTAIPTPISRWCGAGFAAPWAQAGRSYPGGSQAAERCCC